MHVKDRISAGTDKKASLWANSTALYCTIFILYVSDSQCGSPGISGGPQSSWTKIEHAIEFTDLMCNIVLTSVNVVST